MVNEVYSTPTFPKAPMKYAIGFFNEHTVKVPLALIDNFYSLVGSEFPETAGLVENYKNFMRGSYRDKRH
jgi:hypothetical protein